MSDQRFARTRILLGQDGLQRLHEATVMIIGLGAVGGYTLEAVARAGVGHLILVDFDRFDETNINRQILALDSTIGQLKTAVAAARVQEINPQCKVEIRTLFVDAETIPALLDLQPDIVVDAIDSLLPKCRLIAELWRRQIPFISSMGAALKTDSSKIKLASLSQSENCALARKVRSQLRRSGVNLAEVPCVYSSEKACRPKTVLSSGNDSHCVLGSLPTITAIFGLTIANHVILRLSGVDFGE